MKIFKLLIATIALSPTAIAMAAPGRPQPSSSDLAGPWQNAEAAIVLDPYHDNNYEIVDLRLDPKIVAIIHKASEGNFVSDKLYQQRRKSAMAANYLWGSFHLGRPGDGKQQADKYLDFTKPGPNELVARDLEKDGGAMTMAQAADFAREVHARIGRYPLLYGGRDTVSRPASPADLIVLEHCPLWLVSTRQNDPSTYADAYKSRWPRYTLWQFSSELRYRYPIRKAPSSARAVDWRIDVDYYPGDRRQLRQAWPLTPR